MDTQRFTVGAVPCVLWGTHADRVYLYVHGQGGSKEEAASFAALAAGRGCQTLSLDLPGHGERAAEADCFDPWHAAPEIAAVMAYARQRWDQPALFANSIGAYFSMLALQGAPPAKCLFVSPVLNMERLIRTMMGWAGVTEERLAREQTIPTTFGQTLSFAYLRYAQDHPITAWPAATSILYAGRDALIDRATVDEFVRRFSCRLTVMEDGEHWFHTPQQLDVLHRWLFKTL